MKNILKYLAAAALTVVAFTSCEEFEDHTETVKGAPKLAYVNVGEDNTLETLIVHRPSGSTGSFSTEFAIESNSSVHGEATVNIVYDASLVETYNEEHGTAYEALPEEYLVLENTSIVLAANAVRSEETVKVSLSEEADLTELSLRGYVAPLRLDSKGLNASAALGTVWVVVKTENNLLRPISSGSELVGFPASGISGWTADCANFANLFDGSNSTGVDFSEKKLLTVDMKSERMITGLHFYTYAIANPSIEYSLDGLEWETAGTVSAGEYVFSGSSWGAGDYYVAFDGYFTARYLRLPIDFSGYYKTLYALEAYEIESTEPTIYTITGTNNVVSGKVVHRKGSGSTSNVSASFRASVTVASDKGYNVTVAQDNSLVAAYNKANGTNYAALPSQNLNIENASLAIAAGKTQSDDEAKITLKGDLSTLSDKNGYLAAVKLSTTTAGAVVSEGRGVVYVIVDVENNLIRPIKSTDDMIGFPAGGRSSWSATGSMSNLENLFDDNNNTSVNCSSSGNTITVNMGSTHMVTGLHFRSYNISNLAIEYSTDGNVWEKAGTVASGEFIYTGSTWSSGDYYMAFTDYLEASMLRLSFGFSGYYTYIYEMNVYEIESTEPTIYAQCGNDNVLSGTLTHHVTAGSINGVNASFNVMTTISSASGWSVNATVDNSLVAAYNSAHRTSFATLPAANVKIEGTPCVIGADQNRSTGEIKVTLAGDLTSLTNSNGYLIPVKLAAPAGAVVSESRGVVYVEVSVETSSDLFRKNFSPGDIEGSLVADRSGWKILAFDESIHSSTNDKGYENLFDDDDVAEDTYVRTWGGPIAFTVDMGQEYDVTGMRFTSRMGYGVKYVPNDVIIEYSLDGSDYTEVPNGPSKSRGEIIQSNAYGYIAMYGSIKMRYLKISASYGSNMGTSDFNLYVK